MRTYRTIVACCLGILISTSFSHAENDMWDGYFAERNLFTPHSNFCDSSTEAFVAVGPNGDGFCIEKDERTASDWDVAKATCANLKKRLPEPAEYKYACGRPELSASTT